MITRTISIRTQITLSFIAITLLAVLLVSLASYITGKKLLEHATFNTINSIRTIKSGQIVQYLDMLKDECLSTSESTMIFDAIEQLQEGFRTLQATPEEMVTYRTNLEKFYIDEFLPKLNQTATTPYLLSDYFPLEDQTIIAQDWYIAENPQPLQKKSEFSRAATPHPYNLAHEKYHYILKRYAKRVGISDIYMIDISTGYVVYSLTKEVDFGSNLITGHYKDTGLGQSFKAVQKTNDEDFVKIVDFQFYVPEYGNPVGFIGTPIFKQGKKLGVLIFKFPIDDINEIMTYNKQWSDVGLGKTGESFIMGEDKTMRTVAREYIEDPTKYINELRNHGYTENLLDKIQTYDTTVLLKKIDLPFAQQTLEGKTNTLITKDTLGREVIYTYAPIKTTDLQWYVLVKIDTKEAFAPVTALLWQIILLGILIVLFTTLLAFGAIYIFTKPFARIIHFLKNPTLTTTQKLSTDGSSEFVTIANAYNAVTMHIDTMLKKIGEIQGRIRSSNNSLLQQLTSLQKKGDYINMLGDTIEQENQAITDNKKQISELDAQHATLLTQSTATLSLMQTITAQAITYLETMATDLTTIDEQLRGSAADNAKQSDIKSKIQHTLHKSNAFIPTLIGMQNNGEQLQHMIISAQQQITQKSSMLDTIATSTQHVTQEVERLKDGLTQLTGEIKTINTLYERYETIAQQLATAIEHLNL